MGCTSRAAGQYALVSQMPVWVNSQDFALSLEAADFRWLIAYHAYELAMELYGPRCDCVEWRLQLHETLLRADRTRVSLPEIEPGRSSSLRDCPSEAIRFWDRLLRCARIKPQLRGGELTLLPASDQDVYFDSSGEVTKAEGINYRTLKPEMGGLFCEKIFGPTRNWHCHCGKYQTSKYEGITCEQCGVEITNSKVRRERVGHIELPVPVVHPWYLNGECGAMLAKRLNLPEADLERIANCSLFIFNDSSSSGEALEAQLVTWHDSISMRPSKTARVVTGGEAIEILLKRSGAPGVLADAVIMRRLPVLPPDLRPTVRLDSGRFATSDLNELYRSVLNRVETTPPSHRYGCS